MLPAEAMHSKIFDSQNADEFSDILLPILEIFESDAMSGIDAKIDMGVLYIFGHDEKSGEENELMLRLKYPDNYMVVARVQFIHQRCGNMSKLENLILDIAKKYDYKGIRIECANSPEIQNYCHKHGYKEKQYVYGDYNLEI